MAEVKFFTTRRETVIGDFQSLKSRGSERRAKVPIRVPLSNRPTAGIPDWILNGYEFLVKDDSVYNRNNCKDMRLEGMSIEFFTTDSVKRKMMALHACTMSGFYLERVGKDDKAIVYLNFVVYAPCSEEIIVWLYKNQDATVYAEFDATQAEFAYAGESKGGDDDEDEDEGEDAQQSLLDPNDDPKKPIPNDTRKVTKPTDPPGQAKRSHHAKKETVQ